MVAADSGIVDVNWAVLASMRSARTTRHEHWQLRANEAERNRLFEGLEAKDDDAPEQHCGNAKEASVVSSPSFVPTVNDNEAGPFPHGSVDLTSNRE